MKFLEAISMYIDHKHALGYRFRNEEAILLAFCRRIGNIRIISIETKAVLAYLNSGGSVTETWFKKHRVFSSFFHFFLSRGLVKVSPVPRSIPNKTASNFVPYIYSHAELKNLLSAIPATCGARVPIDLDVLRTLILLLYGAGLRIG